MSMNGSMRNLCLVFVAFSSTLTFADDQPELEFQKWSGSVNVPDPVAISFDNRGRAYVTQTQRRKAQDLDIRSNRDWVPNDVGFQTVAEKREFYQRMLAPGMKGNEKRVADLNKDGSHDYLDLMQISEKIHLVEDSDNDGVADRIQVFAEDFKTEVTGIAAGVLWHDGDVYSTVAPDVWRLRDTNGDGSADRRNVMATGFGLHIAYGGHDMHGLTVGPDGKIYWSIGDKGISVTTAEGREFRYPNQGGVLRCNPDGSDFEVFAHGLRNVQELAFDKFGNLFGVDNDSDQPGERERVVYIVRGMDAGWRCNYQYRKDGYNPWMAEKLCVPHFDGQPSYIVPPIQFSINGPAGFAYNPGTALSDSYRDYFFLTGAPNGNQIAFQMQPDGATFTVENEHAVGNGIPIVGINFAPDGGLYGVDWGGGYPLNQTGAVWKMDVAKTLRNPQRARVRQLLTDGLVDQNDVDLVKMMSHADQRIRLNAQFELVRRKATKELVDLSMPSGQRLASRTDSAKAFDEELNLLSRIHAIWGLGQLARAGNAVATHQIEKLLFDPDSEIRAQAARVGTDVTGLDGKLFVRLLNDSNRRVQFFAALGLFKHRVESAVDPLLVMADGLKPSDRYLRHAVSMGLSNCATGEQLAAQAAKTNQLVRLCAVIALREKRSEHARVFLGDSSSEVATAAARAIYDDFSIPSALPDLAKVLATTGHSGEAFLRRAVAANLRVDDPQAAIRLAEFAVNGDVDKASRLDALSALATMSDQPALDRVDGRNRRETKQRNVTVDAKLVSLLSGLIAKSDDSKIRATAMRAAGQLNVPIREETLTMLLTSKRVATDLRLESLNVLALRKSKQLKTVIPQLLESKQSPLRMRALELLAERDPSVAFTRINQLIQSDGLLQEKQLAVSLLGSMEYEPAEQRLLTELKNLETGKIAHEIRLDVFAAAKQRSAGSSAIAELVAKIEAERAELVQQDPVAAFMDCLAGGDQDVGKDIFVNNVSAQCIRCHKLGKKGSTVGPNLAGIAKKRDAAYLLRAIISPSADIDPKYRSQVVILESGKTVTGLPKQETKKELVLVDNAGKEIRIDRDSIDDISVQNISIMPEMKKELSRREIRDLVAFLKTLTK